MPQDSHTWRSYFQAAQGDHRVGDLLVLTEEAPSDRERMESHRTAGMALMDGGQFTLAREQFEAALRIAPADAMSREYLHKLVEPISGSVREAGLVPSTRSWQPRLIFLFTGHMIDKKGRPEPRFPPDKEPIAADAIARTLQEQGAGPEDLAICGGACGGDLLFAEACLSRDLRLFLYLPLQEPAFLAASVTFEKDVTGPAGDDWEARYFTAKNHRLTRVWVTPDDLGPPPEEGNPYARNNLRQLYTALAYGPDKLRVIALWNGHGGDGQGGTEDMIQQAKARGAKTIIIDTKEAFGL
jgi:hypothetical protein